VDVSVKQAEALSYLGDDEGVLDVFQRAERAGDLAPPLGNPLLYHLAAVAALRLGREDQALRWWRQALRQAPGLDMARENLADLSRPVGKRHAPWPFPFSNWVPPHMIREVAQAILAAAGRHDDQAIARATRRMLRDHPHLAALVPLLLDRGDPEGRELALRLALIAGTPDLQAALRDFALGQRGPDALRQQAAQAAVEAGLLPAGTVRLWLEGAWRDLLLFAFEVHGEPTTRHPRPVEEWANQAMAAIHAGDGARAEELLKQALEAEPEAPDLLNNLAAAYELQGRSAEAEALHRQLVERHPDYLFARAGLAQRLIQRRDLADARALLDPLLSRRRLHFSEFAALCVAQIDLYAAEGNLDTARSWLDLWKSADPDHPGIAAMERQLGRAPHRPRWLGG